MRIMAWAIGWLGLGLGVLWGGPPLAQGLYPAGGQAGSRFEVSVAGRFEEWPAGVWTDDAGLVFRPGSIRGRFEVSVGSEVPVGPRLVRFYEPDGATAPRVFVVGADPEFTLAVGEGEEPKGVRLARLPAVVNGRWTGRTREAWVSFMGEPGVVEARLWARGIDSPVQARLRLVDMAGRELAAASTGESPDPLLRVRILVAGEYRWELRAEGEVEVAEEGQSDAVYRLVLAAEPEAKGGLEGGGQASLGVGAGAMPGSAQLTGRLEFPASRHGFISPAADEDRYAFEGRAGDELRFLLRVASLGSPLRPRVRFFGEAGVEVAEVGVGGGDPQWGWRVPATGTYVLAIADAHGRGGMGFGYELVTEAPRPHLGVAVSGHTWRAVVGSRVGVGLEVEAPSHHEGVVMVVARGLPPGVRVPTVVVPRGGGRVELGLEVGREVRPGNYPFQAVLLALDPPHPRTMAGQAPLRGRHAATGQMLVNETDWLWLTVVLPGEG